MKFSLKSIVIIRAYSTSLYVKALLYNSSALGILAFSSLPRITFK